MPLSSAPASVSIWTALSAKFETAMLAARPTRCRKGFTALDLPLGGGLHRGKPTVVARRGGVGVTMCVLGLLRNAVEHGLAGLRITPDQGRNDVDRSRLTSGLVSGWEVIDMGCVGHVGAIRAARDSPKSPFPPV